MIKPFLLSSVWLALPLALLAQAPVLKSPAPASAAKPPTVLHDLWQTAWIDDIRAGWTRVEIQEIEKDGQKLIRGERTIKLTLRRFGDIAKIDIVSGTDETPDGVVKSVFMRQGLGKDVQHSLRGELEGNQFHLTAEGKMSYDKRIPWRPDVVGVYSELKLFERKKPKIGDEFEYPVFEPQLGQIVKVKAKVEAVDNVNFAGQTVGLWRMSAVPEEIGGFQLPASTFWFDGNYQLIRTETAMPGLGKLRFDRSTREFAMEPCVGPDLGLRQSIRLSQRLSNAHNASSIVYRVELPNDKDPSTAFARDQRQTVMSMNGKAVEIRVTPIRTPPEKDAAGSAPNKEYLGSSFFINSDDPTVKQHSADAVKGATDPWQKAKAIENWVHRNMKVQNFTEAMAPADQVAKNLEGDCTEYAMLAAAMCRAAGIPSRTAQGLVYVDGTKGPFLGFHMWFEVFVRGEWVGLDATLGRGHVGAGHLKVSDHSWHEIRTMTPIMPLMRVMIGTPQVTVVKEEG